MNEMNRYLIVLGASVVIVLMAVVIFLTWAATGESIDALADVVEFLEDNDGATGKAVVTLGALALAVLALLWIVVEMAPEDEVKELRIEQAGATTIVPADALRLRLEEALLGLSGVTAARSRVWPRDKGVAVGLELTVIQSANVGEVTQAAIRTVVDTLHEDLGLPVSGTPDVRIAFGGSRAGVPAAAPAPVASPPSQTQRYEPEMPPPPGDAPSQPGHADSSPGPLVYDSSPGDEERADDSPPQQQQ